MKSRTTALLLVALTFLLGGYMVVRAVDLFRTGDVLGVLLGVGLLMLVAVTLLLVVGEVRLGAASQRLAERLHAEQGLPMDPPEVRRTRSGRLPREDADRMFAQRRLEVEAAPNDWRGWWRLAAAYGEARDPKRGRRAMRKAVSLERAERG